MSDSPAPDPVAAYLSEVRKRAARLLPLNRKPSLLAEEVAQDVPRLLAAVERVLALAAKWDREAADGTPYQDREQAARYVRRVIAAELLGEADGTRPCRSEER